MKKKTPAPIFPLLALVIAFATLLVFSAWYGRRLHLQELYAAQYMQACTQEAMLCPDGSYVGRTGPNCEFAACPSLSGSGGVVMGNTYHNNFLGLSFSYPTSWEASQKDISATNPSFEIGNPLSGTSVYALGISIRPNPQNLSAQDFVKKMLTDDAVQDASNTKNGPAPTVTPHFDSQYAITLNGTTTAYELYNVFEFDHNAEQVYVQQNKQMIVFDFPTKDINPNIANPVANNLTAHQIVNTIALDSAVWKFCGGIAAFQCPKGYTCQLDGTFPDAGGHCVK